MAETRTGKLYVDVDTGHDYDGIRELDNRLPRWWLITLYGAIFFGLGYWAWFESLDAAPSQLDDLAAEHAAAAAEEEAERLALAAKGEDPTSAEALANLAAEQGASTGGSEVFQQYCAACHRADGGGLIGPNLCDDHFIHGKDPKTTFEVIANGILDKGMPAWKPVLGLTKTKQVTAYVLKLQGTKVEGGKAPQGTKMASAASGSGR